MFYGQRDFRADRTYLTTEWLAMLYIPLFPLRSLRVRYVGPAQRKIPIGFGDARSYAVYENSRPNWRQVCSTYGLIIFSIGWWSSLFSLIVRWFPNGLAGHDAAFWSIAALMILPFPLPSILRYRAKRQAGLK